MTGPKNQLCFSVQRPKADHPARRDQGAKGRTAARAKGFLRALCVSKDFTQRSQRFSVSSVLSFLWHREHRESQMRRVLSAAGSLQHTPLRFSWKDSFQRHTSTRPEISCCLSKLTIHLMRRARAARQNLKARATAEETIEQFRGRPCLERICRADGNLLKHRSRSPAVVDPGSDGRSGNGGAETSIVCSFQLPLRRTAAGL